MAEKSIDKNLDIVIIESNKIVGKLIEKLLGNVYNVYVYDSAKKALYQLERDLKPFCIISSYQLPELDGAELLARVEKPCPYSVRILLTSINETKKLVEVIKEANVNTYIKKPFENLNFLNLVRTASHIYELRKENASFSKLKSKFSKQYNDLLSTVKTQNTATDTEFKNYLRSISGFIYKAENFHFKPHTKSVLNISKFLADDLGISDEALQSIYYSCQLMGHYKIGLPDKFKLLDPRSIVNKADLEFFTRHFKETIASIISLPSIKTYAANAGKLFENMDGSGFPFGLTGIDIPKEIQVINIVNTYFHYVYCLTVEDLYQLKLNGVVTQTRKETLKKHKDAIIFLYKNLKWFDHDLFYRFQDMLKKCETDDLKIHSEDLVVKYNLIDNGLPKDDNDKREKLSKEILLSQSIVEVLDNEGKVIEKYLKKKVNFENLCEGDLLCEPIRTYSEATLMKAKSIINNSTLNNIKKYIEKKTIPDTFYIRK